MPLIPALRKNRHKDQFRASLGYTVSPKSNQRKKNPRYTKNTRDLTVRSFPNFSFPNWIT